MDLAPLNEAYFLCPALRRDNELAMAIKGDARDQPDGVFFFVHPHHSNHISVKEKHGHLYERASELNLNVRWLKQTEFSSVMTYSYPIVIFASLVSPEYGNWTTFTASLGGAQKAIVYSCPSFESKLNGEPHCFQVEKGMLKNTAMRSMRILLAGFTGNEEQDLIKKVNVMGGEVQATSTDLKMVDFIVTTNALEKSALEGAELHIPVLEKDWILEVFRDNDSKRKFVVTANDKKYKSFLISIFHGVKVYFPVINTNSLVLAEDAVKNKGGIILRSIEDDNPPHVIVVDTPDWPISVEAGKYNIVSTTSDWVGESVMKKTIVCPRQHLIKNPVKFILNEFCKLYFPGSIPGKHRF